MVGNPKRLDGPDLVGVLHDGRIGREGTHRSDGRDGTSNPGLLVLVGGLNLLLSGEEAVEVIRDEVVVGTSNTGEEGLVEVLAK